MVHCIMHVSAQDSRRLSSCNTVCAFPAGSHRRQDCTGCLHPLESTLRLVSHHCIAEMVG